MKKNTTMYFVLLAAVGLIIGTSSGAALAGDRDLCYEVTVTNMTRAQVFTPVLVVTHKKGVKLFTAGEPASVELAKLAESGDVDPLADLLETLPHKVGTIAVSEDGPFGPGESVTVLIPASRKYNRMSLASMLAVTNDGFVALNGVPAWQSMYTSPVYDAGSEMNDELAINIPGKGGEGYNPADGEGFVHVHAGIHGIGDLPAFNMDWRNPAAKITIELVRCDYN
jgi:hypothetical protein